MFEIDNKIRVQVGGQLVDEVPPAAGDLEDEIDPDDLPISLD
jgi:hypothetical protein